MKRSIIFIVVMFLIKTQGIAQTLSERELVGTWTIVELVGLEENIQENKDELLILFNEAFIGSKFVIKEDQNFSFEIEIEEMKMENKYWRYDSLQNIIYVHEWSDKDLNNQYLIGLKIKKDQEKIFFLLSDTYFVFEVRKEMD